MKHLICLLTVLLLAPAGASAQYDAVVSVTPAVEGSCIAVEIAMENGAALAGLQWFHNDGGQVFPKVVIVEGQAGSPPDLSQPGLILDQVTGVSMDWGQLTLSSPVTSSTGTAFAVFFFPPSVATTSLGDGGGPGIGLRETGTDNAPFYLSVDAAHWARFDPGFELGVQPMLAAMRGEVPSIAEVGVQVELPATIQLDLEMAPATALGLPSPNPFNPRVTLSYMLAAPSVVDLKVYDVRGRLVDTLVSGSRAAGPHAEVWDGVDQSGRPVASGVYFARFEAGPVVQTQRMVLVR
ncbi:hypothetical protein DRQ32_07045 [bacterium]|nr:MAG: hypothetical protein DRQ32_07045 [bacterium]RLA18180.1 MAG: hypothetical protein DRQ56_08125 [Gammaproteobacteria bacterium]